jgi:two-component system, sensor histidine kinase and response regulator
VKSHTPADFQALTDACARLERMLEERTAELADAREQVAQLAGGSAEAARARRQFLTDMSHELRTPMSGVLGMTELLAGTALTAEQRGYIDVLAASSRSLLRVVDDILDVSDIDAGRLQLELEPFQLHRCVGDVLRTLAPSARAKGLELIGYVDPRLPEAVSGDLTRLHQVMSHLAGNAIEFTPSGEVAVEVHPSPLPAGAGQRVLHVIVRDTGVGIPLDRQRALVAAFEPADGSAACRFGGAGLGLAISHLLVQMMGGRLWVESTPGSGSRFQFTVAVEVEEGTPSLADAYRSRLGGRSILVMDDHAAARGAVALTLEACDAVATLTGRGPAALAALGRRSAERAPFDAIVFDLPGPETDAAGAVMALQAAAPGVPLVIQGSSQDAGRCRELPVAAFVAVPAPAPALLSAVASALTRATDAGRRTARRERFQGMRVLVAEDNPINQQVISLMLEGWGMAVTIAPSGREALAALDRDAFDVVFMDLQMPDGDGVQTTRAIRKREKGSNRRLPVIALTAQRDDRARCLAAGMDDYLSKPVVPAELADMLDRVTVPSAG